MRQRRLMREPLCRDCAAQGRITASYTPDHIVPLALGGTDTDDNVRCLCRACHQVRTNEFFGSQLFDVDEDGWPIDARHPANQPRSFDKRINFGLPFNLRRPAIPVTLICGPPAAGKTTWVDAHKQPGDTVISLDDCKVHVGGRMWDTDHDVWHKAIKYRDSRLRGLASLHHGHAYVVIGAPTIVERNAWCAALGVPLDRLMVLATPAAVCLQRIRTDPARSHARVGLMDGVLRWHRLFDQDERAMTRQQKIKM